MIFDHQSSFSKIYLGTRYLILFNKCNTTNAGGAGEQQGGRGEGRGGADRALDGHAAEGAGPPLRGRRRRGGVERCEWEGVSKEASHTVLPAQQRVFR